MEQEGTSESRRAWLGYTAEFLTIFFALTVLTGRIYSQSYWNVFGLSPEHVDTMFIDYAIISPNATIASIMMAIGVVIMVAFHRQSSPDIIGNRNPIIIYYMSWLAFILGMVTIGVIMKVDSSTWTIGTAGIAFGFGYLVFIAGIILLGQAITQFKRLEKKERSKWAILLFGWVRNIPRILIQTFLMTVLVLTSFWSILNTAQTFGANEAKFMYNMRPTVTLQLDSANGFEDLPLSTTLSGAVLLKVRIITEAGEFLYVSTDITGTPPKLSIRAVPVSRVQSMQYKVDVTPIGD